MILTCPDCATRYHVDPASLGPEGRTVRCANCGRRWLGRPPADLPRRLAATSPLAELHPIRVRPVHPPKENRRGGYRTLAAWLAAVVALLVVASALVGRDQIVAAFPASAPFYQTLGLPVTVELGLDFENVSSERLEERGVAILVLEGEIVNQSGHRREVPPVRVTLLDESGRALQEHVFLAEDSVLAAGGTTRFSERVVNPSEQARRFSLTFDVRS